MTGTSGDRNSGAFGWWLRTGRLPPALNPDGLELKFNPWHDPADGRFTIAGAGRYFGAGGSDAAGGGATPTAGRRLAAPPGAGRAGAETSGAPAGRSGTLAHDRPMPGRPGSATKARKRIGQRAPVDRANPLAAFVGGVGESLYGVGKDTVGEVRAVLTTNPATTIGDVGRGVAGMIDAAIAAEDTPARVQVSRAARAVADASARDLGRAAGSVAGNVALAAAPGAVISKAAALRRLRMARPRPVFEPPKVDWRRENLRSDKPWKHYNDTATGARDGFAPALTRTIPNGSKRPVKFDGIEGDYVIDRKWKVVNSPRSRAQLLRQMEALAQNRLTGTWEVPNAKQKAEALKLFKKMNATRHKVRVVKP